MTEPSRKLRLEVWGSNQMRSERHYFLVEDGDEGVEEGIYLCGVNPEVVCRANEYEILRVLGYGRELEELRMSEVRDIGWAVKQLHNGSRVCRSSWNGKGIWLALQVPDAHSKMSSPYVYMSTADGKLVPWLCSQADLLAVDWELAA